MSDNTGGIHATIMQGFLKGDPGDTPVKGLDYWTKEDIKQMIAEVIAALPQNRVTSLNEVDVAGAAVIEAVGNPVYVDDVSHHARFGITEKGWYLFAKVAAKEGTTVTEGWSVEGADGCIVTVGNNFVELAVKFDVAAISKKVVINWGAETEVFVFKATDLAVRNLDYRVTFYVYDVAPYTTWEYALTADVTFGADKYYWIQEEDGTYSAAEVTAGEAVPAYYTLADEVYTQATGVFENGVTYYTKNGTEYTAAEVTVGDAIPAYYAHSKVTISGMVRNITFVCDVPIDCPVIFNLPEIEDETHGCWYEIRFRHTGTYSSTLVVPEGVKVATEHTQAETAGVNMVDLHYTAVGDTKLWRFMNTHSTIPAA